MRGYADTPSFAYFNYYEQNLTGNSLVGTDKWWQGIYDTDLEQKARVRRGRLRHHGKFHDHGRRPLVRVRPHYRLQQQAPPGFTGAKFLDDKVDNERERLGLEAER